MTQNDAYILANEVGGSAYCAGLYFWRVMVKLDNGYTRIYESATYYYDQL